MSDNLNTHTRGAFYEVFEPARARALVRRIDFCHTPKHSSWLNVAESELGCMTRQCPKDRRLGDIETLRNEIAAWSADVNDAQRGVDWQMGIGDARRKLKSVYPQTSARSAGVAFRLSTSCSTRARRWRYTARR